ncbi:MAG: YgiQ family radical SAM protein [Proteobacteria bacterium]|nr:YgiQ family radical SAM protein [Pseudomonadota bacterium]
MFLPSTAQEMEKLGWDRADIILISGDSYIDSPYIGVAVIGRVLTQAGFRTAIIAQPDMDSEEDITRLGEPTLFWGVTGGSVDSLVANYTATGKKRKSDDFTPGGVNNRRPDRALIQYTNLIRRHFKNTSPIVLGGVEASLRRICHYDAWSKTIRKSVLFDAKGDYLVYGMGERTVVELAMALKDGINPEGIRGLCYIAKQSREGYLELPSHETVIKDNHAFISMFHLFYKNNDPLTAQGLVQKQDARYLIQNPPTPYLTQKELDNVHDLPYERDLHPHERIRGDVKALDTIRFSIPTHRGCYGECRFCAISVHQGRTVRWRSEESILKEAQAMTRHPSFTGIIRDAGGPTANMYGFECEKKLSKGACENKSCLFPKTCSSLKPDHGKLINLLQAIRRIKGIKHVFTASGIRYDLLFADQKKGRVYLQEIVNHHVSGQLKIAPEHSEKEILDLMNKPGTKDLLAFKKEFDTLSRKAGKKQFLTYYLIAAHPGCNERHMANLKTFALDKLGLLPEQVQVFTPTPSTYSTLMYATGIDPFTLKKIHVEKTHEGREKQKTLITGKPKPFPKKKK